MIKFLREFFDPFELLYISIAVATFDHTVWAGAFLFEGSMPVDNNIIWRLKGSLIAIAVDLGMLLTSRFLRNSETPTQTIVLVIAFMMAAVTSFYFQMVYILFHTPIFTISEGVDKYWIQALTPFLQARVVILPLALPLLATVYTLARIFTHRVAVKKELPIPTPEVKVEKPKQELLDDGKRTNLEEVLKALENVDDKTFYLEFPTLSINVPKLEFYYTKTDRMYSANTREKLANKIRLMVGRWENTDEETA